MSNDQNKDDHSHGEDDKSPRSGGLMGAVKGVFSIFGGKHEDHPEANKDQQHHEASGGLLSHVVKGVVGLAVDTGMQILDKVEGTTTTKDAHAESREAHSEPKDTPSDKANESTTENKDQQQQGSEEAKPAGGVITNAVKGAVGVAVDAGEKILDRLEGTSSTEGEAKSTENKDQQQQEGNEESKSAGEVITGAVKGVVGLAVDTGVVILDKLEGSSTENKDQEQAPSGGVITNAVKGVVGLAVDTSIKVLEKVEEGVERVIEVTSAQSKEEASTSSSENNNNQQREVSSSKTETKKQTKKQAGGARPSLKIEPLGKRSVWDSAGIFFD